MEVSLAVYVIWWILLAVAVLVVLPLVVYLLHRTLRAARQIERYAASALAAGEGISGNTANIGSLETTISEATEILDTSGSIRGHTGSIEEVFEARTGGRLE